MMWQCGARCGNKWEQEEHVVVRVAHPEREVRYLDRHGQWQSGSIAQAQSQARKVATAQTELEIRLQGQPQAKRQRVQAVLSAQCLSTGAFVSHQRPARRCGQERDQAGVAGGGADIGQQLGAVAAVD